MFGMAGIRAGSDAFMLEALFRTDAWGFMLQPVSPENERAVCQSMIDGCRCAAYSSRHHAQPERGCRPIRLGQGQRYSVRL